MTFQFTPLREGRRLLRCNAPCRLPFQFTPLREGRRRQGNPQWATETISIHAPPRGATRACAFAPPHNLISIHAPPRGATRSHRGREESPRNFNSRPSARGDCPVAINFAKARNFNSRPSARGDAIEARSRSGYAISIHAPPRGATSSSVGVTSA